MRRTTLKIAGSLICLCIVVTVAGIWWLADSPKLEGRLRLMHLKVLGALPDEPWSRLIQRMKPYSSEGPVLEPIRVIHVLNSPSDLAEGKRLFQSHCVQCHGADGGGQLGPDLSSEAFQQRVQDSDIYKAIAEGVEGTSMAGFAGSAPEGLRLAAFVRSLKDSSSRGSEASEEPDPPGPKCPSCGSIDVSYRKLLDAETGSAEWLTYSGSYTGQRYSSLTQINKESISRLRPRWVHQMRSLDGVQSTPLVVHGVMFLTGPENQVIALDAGTGETLWVFSRVVPNSVPVCCGRRNRGVAILGKRLYHATLDGHLIALDVATGKPNWDVEVADPGEGFSMTGAPLAVKDKIIVGIAGGDFGVRGFLDAYDAETGKRVWRFHTIPEPGEKGHESWENDAWKTGGGATWVTGSFDPDLNLLYWGVGNPAPTYDGDYRPGDNLYTSSVIALDPDTGELKWHFQFTPHDTNDWDAAQVPVLADLEYQGEGKKLMLWANRNCFYYILDRETGRFLQAKEYCEQSWSDGFTAEGRPIRRPNTRPTLDGIAGHPSSGGGSNWHSPAYSPRTKLYYVTYRLSDQTIYRREDAFLPGRMFDRGWARRQPGGRNGGGLRAIDAATGNRVWESMYSGLASKAGLLVTGADLLFTVDRAGILYALDAKTGEEAWRMRLGGEVQMGPITYLHEGKQQLAVIAQGALFVLDLME